MLNLWTILYKFLSNLGAEFEVPLPSNCTLGISLLVLLDPPPFQSVTCRNTYGIYQDGKSKQSQKGY